MHGWKLVLALFALCLAVSACATDDGEGVATLGDGASEPPASESSESPDADPQEAMLEFTQCMRDEGIDMPDARGDGVGIIVDHNSGIDPESPAFKAAEKKCRPLLDKVMQQARENVDPEDEARMQEAMLEFAECMRDEGIDFPDPQMEDGAVRIAPGDGVDPDDPAVQAAHEKCTKLLPGDGLVREEGP